MKRSIRFLAPGKRLIAGRHFVIVGGQRPFGQAVVRGFVVFQAAATRLSAQREEEVVAPVVRSTANGSSLENQPIPDRKQLRLSSLMAIPSCWDWLFSHYA